MSTKLAWRKATASNVNGCIEVVDRGIDLRDSKRPRGPILNFSRREFAAFVLGVQLGEFDDLVDAVRWDGKA